MSDTTYDLHCAGAGRLGEIIGLISADHPQLWPASDLITRAAETISERHAFPWEFCCTIAEHEYDCTRPGTTLRAALRYRRRVWARDCIGATVTPETRETPLPAHGPNPCAYGCDRGRLAQWGDPARAITCPNCQGAG